MPKSGDCQDNAEPDWVNLGDMTDEEIDAYTGNKTPEEHWEEYKQWAKEHGYAD